MRAALYVRVSTKDKEKDGQAKPRQHTANQIEEIRSFCQSQEWEIVAEYEDHETGSRADCTQFQALIRDASQRRFDVVVFWALDRFTREGALQTLQYLNLLSTYGVGYRSFTEPYLDSCGMFKDAVIAILGTIAKQERVRISERVRAGLNRARIVGTRSGKAIGRPRAVFRRDEVQELRAKGMSWRQIACRTGVSITSVRRACGTTPDTAEATTNPV